MNNRIDRPFEALGYRQRRVQQLVWCVVVALAVALIGNVIAASSAITNIILAMSVLTIIYANKRLRDHQNGLLVCILLWTITLAVTQLIISNQGLSDPAILAYPGVLVYAAMIGGPRLFLSLTAFMVTALSIVGYATVTGYLEYIPKPPSWLTTVDIVVIIAAIAYSAWLLASDLQFFMGRLERVNLNAKESQEKLRHLIQHDELTGLPNISLCDSIFLQSLARSQRGGQLTAVMLLDLDEFKTINDSLGYVAGDEFLKGIAECLKKTVRKTDTVSRLGGDEFVVILESIPSQDAVANVASNILKNISQSFQISSRGVSSSCSLGIAMAPADGELFSVLRLNAELAMYKAKEAGRNTFRFYDETMNSNMIEHLELVNGLRRAIGADELRLYFQPKYQLPGEKLVGAEALIRWFQYDGTTIMPSKFIPIAETSGLIVDIGEWVLNESCLQCKKWHDAGHTDLSVAVNLSFIQFRHGDLERVVTGALERAGLPPSSLELELTEYLLIEDSSHVKDQLQSLKQKGISIAIDDFGTGYSNLGYLNKFEVETLKIDQSFVLKMAEFHEDEAIVRAILQMAKSLGLKTVAEGVENIETLDMLKLLSCDYYQGFFGSEPLAEDDFTQYLADYQALPVLDCTE